MYLVMSYCEWACRPWNMCMLVQFSHSVFVAPWTAACQASLFITNSWTCSNLCPLSQRCHPTILSSVLYFSCLQSFLESGSFLMSQFFTSGAQRPKYWSISFSISPSSEYSGLISFRMDWLDLLAVQGTLKSLLQHRSSKISFLQRSTFFIVLSHLRRITRVQVSFLAHTGGSFLI